MKEHIPYSISEYVNKHFREDFLFSCHRILNNGKPLYDVEVSKDDITHHLMFDEKGMLLKENVEPDFFDDQFEESFQQ